MKILFKFRSRLKIIVMKFALYYIVNNDGVIIGIIIYKGLSFKRRTYEYKIVSILNIYNNCILVFRIYICFGTMSMVTMLFLIE